jgi:hypothetical protein
MGELDKKQKQIIAVYVFAQTQLLWRMSTGVPIGVVICSEPYYSRLRSLSLAQWLFLELTEVSNVD